MSVGIILTTDKILKTAIVAASIRFPSALFGMFYLFSILVILSFLFFENNSSYTWFHCPGWCNWFDGFLWNFSHFHSKVVVVVLYSFFGCTWLEPKLPVWFIFLFFYFFSRGRGTASFPLAAFFLKIIIIIFFLF